MYNPLLLSMYTLSPTFYFNYHLNNKSGFILIFLSICICLATVNPTHWVKILGELAVYRYMKSIIYAVSSNTHSFKRQARVPPSLLHNVSSTAWRRRTGSPPHFLPVFCRLPAAALWGFCFRETRGHTGLVRG